MSDISSIYARKLFSMSVRDVLKEYQDELNLVVSIYKNDASLRNLLSDPGVEQAKKRETVKNGFDGKVRAELLGFLITLINEGCFRLLPGIAAEFTKTADIYRHDASITIHSAHPLDKPEVDRICERFRVPVGSGPAGVDVRIDPSLIGGVKVTVGDMVYDGSIKGKLDRLREVLTGR